MEQVIAELIEASRQSVPELAKAGDIAPNTIYKAARLNAWPPQKRPRLALARLLGVEGDPIAAEPAPQSAGVGNGSDEGHPAHPSEGSAA